MPTERPSTWVDEEPGARAVWRELGRLRRRAMARPLRPLLYTILMTAALVGVRARKQRVFTSRVVLRVTEGDLDAATAPRPARALKDYVLDVAFSSQRLLEVIRANSLYRRELKKDPNFAVETMREDIQVEVWRNYFMEERSSLEAGRSARVAINYTADDAKQALTVVQQLGKLVGEQEEAQRIKQAEDTAQFSRDAVAEARTHLSEVRGKIVAKQLAARRASPEDAALLHVEINNLNKSIEPLETRLHDLEQRRTAMEMRASLEKNQLGLRFEVVDPGRAARPGVSKPRELIQLAILLFVLLLPVAGIAAAAFDSRIYDAEDIRRLGLEAVGHVDRFPGDNVGTLEARLARDRGMK